jgi:hypothetical protein
MQVLTVGKLIIRHPVAPSAFHHYKEVVVFAIEKYKASLITHISVHLIPCITCINKYEQAFHSVLRFVLEDGLGGC